MKKTAVITGAGSGVGRAVAVALVQQGWRVALLGRRENALRETAQLAGLDQCLVCPCDIRRPGAVEAVAKTVLSQFETVEVLVNAAGTNVPKRSLAELSPADYEEILGANLHGAYYCAQAFLPTMRRQKSGTIINVVSEAGKWASAKSGPAYVMSKFGQAGLNQSINAEERRHGIRACAIFPGDIDTPLLEKRPEPPSAEARQKMLRPEDVAACVILCVNLPPRAVAEEILLRPA
jgi:NAD(P)-dependent dehydrogenase (short-subunit alcohol dehydrogenase family)